MIEIMLVKEPGIMRDGLEFIITGNFPNISIESYSAEELNAQMLKTKTPNLIIVELTEDNQNILHIIRYYVNQNIKLAILLSELNNELFHEVLSLDVYGYLYDKMSPTEFISAIRAILNSYNYMHPEFLKQLLRV